MGQGPPVVLLHGLTCNAGYWLRVGPLLAGVRVVALDFRGHGLSEHRDSYRYADYERDLLTLFDELGLDRVVVAGHSLGGYVALPRRLAAIGSAPCSHSTSRVIGRRRTPNLPSDRGARRSGSSQIGMLWSTDSRGPCSR